MRSKYWRPDRFDIVEGFEYNCTLRLRREGRQIVFQLFDQIFVVWREHFGGIVLSKTKPVLAKAIETTPEALIVILDGGPVSIPWERGSERLARASLLELSRAELSPLWLWYPLTLD